MRAARPEYPTCACLVQATPPKRLTSNVPIETDAAISLTAALLCELRRASSDRGLTFFNDYRKPVLAPSISRRSPRRQNRASLSGIA
jgi:hypothetical protein